MKDVIKVKILPDSYLGTKQSRNSESCAETVVEN